jgi:hypothetical protein
MLCPCKYDADRKADVSPTIYPEYRRTAERETEYAKFWRMMLTLKTAGMHFGTRRMMTITLNGILGLASLLAGTNAAMAQAVVVQNKFGQGAPVTYDNRYELYGGINFMNFQAGQDLPKRMNFAGGEALATYWLTRHLGLGLDYRGEAGTTPVLPNAFVNNRPLVYMNMLMVGAQYRGPKNHYAAINYHGYFGAADGVFSYSTAHVPPAAYKTIGLYTDRTKPIGAVGGSVDFNASKEFAVRLSPDLIFEHFGTETREFFAISGGIIYRFGKR